MNIMTYFQTVRTAAGDPAELETLYQAAIGTGDAGEFVDAIEAGYREQPENLLYAAWHFRLAHAAAQVANRRTIAWLAAIVLAALNAIVYWWLSDFQRYSISLAGAERIPDFLLLWAPIAALFALAFLVWAGGREWQPALLLAVVTALLAAVPFLAYTQLSTPALQEQYLVLALFHLPLIAWGIVGIFLLRHALDRVDGFAFLVKSFEVIVMGGLFAIALGIFTGVSIALFGALGVEMPEWVQRIFVPGSVGLVPVLAIAIIYNPRVAPALQSFEEGLSRLIAVLMRMMLPLTLAILVIYLVFIPFNFWEPFRNRDVLIIYNAMLFAVMALLAGATPVTLEGMPALQQRWLRRGLIAVALLALTVGIYALSALAYRTFQEGWTPNRLAFIGWNVINSALLFLLLIGQWRSNAQNWLSGMKGAFSAGMIAYAVWSLAVLLLVPLFF